MLKKVVTLMSGAIVGQIIAFAALPIISRIYLPEQLGSFQIMLAYCNTIGVVSALSLERTFLLNISRIRAHTLKWASRCVVICAAAISVPMYLVFSNFVLSAPLVAYGFPVLIFVFLTVLFRGLFLVDYTIAISEDRVRAASLSVLTKDIARVISRISLGMTALNPAGLFIAGALDWATGSAVLWRSSRKRKLKPDHMFRVLWRYRDYPIFYAPAAALTTLSAQIPVFLIGIFFTSHDVGKYAMAFLLLDRPSRIFAKASGDILMRSVAVEKKDNGTAFRNLAIASFSNSAGLVFIAFTVYFFIEILMGDSWSGTGVLAFSSIPHALALFVSDTSLGMMSIVARSYIGVVRQVASCISIILGFCASFYLNFTAEVCILISGICHVLVQVFFTLTFTHGRTGGR